MSAPLVRPELLSHGTIECSDIAATRRFLSEFLGIDVVRPLPEAQYLWKGGVWSVVCVRVEDSEAKEQDPRNHFKLSVRSAEAVTEARNAAIAHKDAYGIRKIGELETSAATCAFKLQDLNRVWWEITTINQNHYDKLFADGDKA